MIARMIAAALALAPAIRVRAAEVVVWPQRPAIAVAGAEAAARAAGHTPVAFGPLRDRLEREASEQEAATSRALAAIDAALQAGRAAYVEQRYDAMIDGLLAVESAAVTLPESLCRATLWDVEFHLGLAHQARARPGDEARARDRYALAHAIDEPRRPEVALYGPDVGFAFLQAIDGARAARPVRITTRPEGAEVVIDCRAGASTTARPGLHAVRIDAPGFVVAARVIELGADAAMHVALQPGDDADLGARWVAGTLDVRSPAVRAALRRAAGPASIVWLDAEAGRTLATWIADGELRRSAAGGDPGEAVALLFASTPKETTRAEAPRRGLSRRAKIGLGVAGAALGCLAVGLGLGFGIDPQPGRLQLVVR